MYESERFFRGEVINSLMCLTLLISKDQKQLTLCNQFSMKPSVLVDGLFKFIYFNGHERLVEKAYNKAIYEVDSEKVDK